MSFNSPSYSQSIPLLVQHMQQERSLIATELLGQIESFMKGRQQCVKINRVNSSWIKPESGIQ